MHRHHLVEEIGRDHTGAGPHELKPHQERFGPAYQEEHDRHEDVHHADLLVIDGGHPIVEHAGPRRADKCGFLVMIVMVASSGRRPVDPLFAEPSSTPREVPRFAHSNQIEASGSHP